jgi:hypothetical protein
MDTSLLDAAVKLAREAAGKASDRQNTGGV